MIQFLFLFKEKNIFSEEISANFENSGLNAFLNTVTDVVNDSTLLLKNFHAVLQLQTLLIRLEFPKVFNLTIYFHQEKSIEQEAFGNDVLLVN